MVTLGYYMSEIDEISQEILESLKKNDGLRRKHANFWNFYKKSSKELGLFSEVFEQFQKDFGVPIEEWGLCDTDPPDIFAKLIDGSVRGVEITELVNEKAIRDQIAGSGEYSQELFRFDYEESKHKLNDILAEKENKVAAIRTEYDSLSLLIHTDEFLLNSELFIGKGPEIFSNSSEVFDGVYLLFSYEPAKQKCPLLRLI
jgi:hypothetical protein